MCQGRGLGIPFCSDRSSAGAGFQAEDDLSAHHRHVVRVRVFTAHRASQPDAPTRKQHLQFVRDLAVVVYRECGSAVVGRVLRANTPTVVFSEIWAGLFIRLQDGTVSSSFALGYDEKFWTIVLFVVRVCELLSPCLSVLDGLLSFAM